MADYIRTPSRMFPDMSDLEASAFLSSEKARSMGFHHHQAGAAFGPYPRLPALPLATIQQHLISMQRTAAAAAAANGPSGSGAFPQHPTIPFPHHLLSQWTSLAAGFGLNQLGLFGIAAPPAVVSEPTSKSVSSASSNHHRFSPYPPAAGGKPTEDHRSGAEDDSSSSNANASSPTLV